MAVFQTQAPVEIKLGEYTFLAKKPTMGQLVDLYAQKEKGELTDFQLSLKILYIALKGANPEMTEENFEEGLTTDMAEDMTKAFESLGIADNKKK